MILRAWLQVLACWTITPPKTNKKKFHQGWSTTSGLGRPSLTLHHTYTQQRQHCPTQPSPPTPTAGPARYTWIILIVNSHDWTEGLELKAQWMQPTKEKNVFKTEETDCGECWDHASTLSYKQHSLHYGTPIERIGCYKSCKNWFWYVC